MTDVAGPIHVVYIDSDRERAAATAERLESVDPSLDVTTAGNAADGLAALTDRTVDCVVSAYDLPDRDGLALLESVRESSPDLPFVLYTAAGSEAVASEAISAGVSEYIRRDAGPDQERVLADRIVALAGAARAERGTDRPARRDADREIERTRDLLAHTERIADVGGWEIDADTREVFWTENLFDLLGIESGEEPPLAEALDVYHEDDRQAVADAVEAGLDAAEPFDITVRFRRGDGQFRWLRVQGDPVVEDGDVTSLRGAVKDVTDRRTRERVLREMYEIISDRDRTFDEQVQALLELGRAELNTEYGTLSRIEGEDYLFELVATDDDSIAAGDVVPVSATNCEIAASTEQTLVLGDVARDAPGETDRTGYTEWGISCYLGAPLFVDDEVYGTFCFYGTEARTGQFSEWERTLVDLMSRWASYGLQQRETQRRLREQNEQLDQFASVVSHDLRNPLNVAKGHLEMVADECDNPSVADVAQAHERMERLIEDLLTLARQGDAVSDVESVELRPLVEQCWDAVDTDEATLVIDVDARIGADRGRLRQLFENLVRNAVEHGGEAVSVRVGGLEDGFFVADDGPGIPEDRRETVFESGYSTGEDGAGIGLTIVKTIADAHGWDVEITTSEMGGARFEFTDVSLVTDEADDAPMAASAAGGRRD
jgi:PAS domain S-box-containing protein